MKTYLPGPLSRTCADRSVPYRGRSLKKPFRSHSRAEIDTVLRCLSENDRVLAAIIYIEVIDPADALALTRDHILNYPDRQEVLLEPERPRLVLPWSLREVEISQTSVEPLLQNRVLSTQTGSDGTSGDQVECHTVFVSRIGKQISLAALRRRFKSASDKLGLKVPLTPRSLFLSGAVETVRCACAKGPRDRPSTSGPSGQASWIEPVVGWLRARSIGDRLARDIIERALIHAVQKQAFEPAGEDSYRTLPILNSA